MKVQLSVKVLSCTGAFEELLCVHKGLSTELTTFQALPLLTPPCTIGMHREGKINEQAQALNYLCRSCHSFSKAAHNIMSAFAAAHDCILATYRAPVQRACPKWLPVASLR